MARAIWKGSISFGLVEIPVALQSAEKREEKLDFTMLDARDHAPVGYRRVNKNTGEEVPWEKIVKGYEYEKDQFVVLTDQDLERANVEATKTIEVIEFVDANEIEPVYYAKPYYLEPTRKASKGYVVLRETLRRTEKVGIARIVIRTRQHIAALIVRGPALAIVLLRYAHELRSPNELDIPEGSLKSLGVTEMEVSMAERLVEGMTAAWDPTKYKDEYHEDVVAVIRRKVEVAEKGIEEIAPERKPARKPARIHDLMSLLKQSVAKTEGRGVGGADGATRRPAKKTTPKSRKQKKPAKTAG